MTLFMGMYQSITLCSLLRPNRYIYSLCLDLKDDLSKALLVGLVPAKYDDWLPGISSR